MKKATESLDVTESFSDDGAGDPAGKSSEGGLFRSLFRLVTLPFRIAAALVGAVVKILGLVLATLLLPVRAAIAVVRRIVGLAADITFALWRLVLMLVGVVVGLVKFVFSVLNATIGGAIRLVFRIVTGSVKLVLGTFLFVTGIGRKRRKAKRKTAKVAKAKAKTKGSVAKAKGKALDLAA